MKRLLFRAAPLLVAGIVVDLSTKEWAVRALSPHQPEPLWGEAFRLALMYNPGVAFGFMAGDDRWVTLAGSAATLALAGWFVYTSWAGKRPPGTEWAVGLLLGGAFGNLLDRLVDGRVVDFLSVAVGELSAGQTFYVTFNVADVLILVGAAALLTRLRLSPRRGATTEPEQRGDERAEQCFADKFTTLVQSL